MANPFDQFDGPQENPFDKYGVVPERSRRGRGARADVLAAQNVNSGLYTGVMGIPDLIGMGVKAIGLSPKDTPLPSQYIQQWGQKARDALGITYNPNLTPETTQERAIADVGNAAGQAASMIIPGAVLAKTGAAPATVGLNVAAPTLANTGKVVAPAVLPSYGQTVGQAMASNPYMQFIAGSAGNLTTDFTGNPYLGMLASFGVPLSVAGAQRAVSAAPAPKMSAEAERRAILKTAQEEGIPVSFGNMIGSKGAQFFESVLSKLPFVGGRQAQLVEDAKTAFDRAAINKIPEVAGEGIPAYTPGNRDMVGKRIGAKFDALENGATINIDSQVGADLAKARADFSKNLEANMSPRVLAQLNELSLASAAGFAGQKPQISGEVYKNIRSDLSKMLTSVTGTDHDAVVGMINALDGAVERSLPKDMVKDWQDVRQSWQRHMMLKGATDARHNASTDVGHIPPGSLAARVGNDKQMERLAQVGTSFVGDKTPDSGTAMRQLVLSGLIGGGAHFGAGFNPYLAAATAGGGYAVDAALNNPVARAMLMYRYNHPTESVVKKGLVATLAAQQAANNGREP